MSSGITSSSEERAYLKKIHTAGLNLDLDSLASEARKEQSPKTQQSPAISALISPRGVSRPAAPSQPTYLRALTAGVPFNKQPDYTKPTPQTTAKVTVSKSAPKPSTSSSSAFPPSSSSSSSSAGSKLSKRFVSISSVSTTSVVTVAKQSATPSGSTSGTLSKPSASGGGKQAFPSSSSSKSGRGTLGKPPSAKAPLPSSTTRTAQPPVVHLSSFSSSYRHHFPPLSTSNSNFESQLQIKKPLTHTSRQPPTSNKPDATMASTTVKPADRFPSRMSYAAPSSKSSSTPSASTSPAKPKTTATKASSPASASTTMTSSTSTKPKVEPTKPAATTTSSSSTTKPTATTSKSTATTTKPTATTTKSTATTAKSTATTAKSTATTAKTSTTTSTSTTPTPTPTPKATISKSTPTPAATPKTAAVTAINGKKPSNPELLPPLSESDLAELLKLAQSLQNELDRLSASIQDPALATWVETKLQARVKVLSLLTDVDETLRDNLEVMRSKKLVQKSSSTTTMTAVSSTDGRLSSSTGPNGDSRTKRVNKT